MAERAEKTNRRGSPAVANGSQQAGRLISVLWYLAVIPSFLAFGYTILAAGDLWWHLATGRWILEHGYVPRVDSWSFTRSGQVWLQHEWLADVLYQLVAVFFG